MQRRFVYLAGPVLGQTELEAKFWREDAAQALSGYNIVGISPLRCEPPHGYRYSNANPDPLFGVPSGIMSKNMFDVKNCDMVLAYMPEEMPLSVGTLLEIGWARAFDKPIVLVTTGPLADHPVLKGSVGWIVSSLEDAIEVCTGILGGYCEGGKNV